jgi:hypothetical protein
MDPITAEVLKILIQAGFAYARQQGLSQAEIEAAYYAARKDFYSRNPADLPDPK